MIGQKVEDFTLKDQNGEVFNLYSNLDKKVLLVFYPKDNSKVCTKQLNDYQLHKTLFDEHNIRIIGINYAGSKSHTKFCEEIGINLLLLTDERKEISRRFDAVGLFGLIRRKLILIDTDKKIVFENQLPSYNYLKSEELLAKLEKQKLI
jgi:thioredoxin-dependent peroxiredoxin